MFFSGENGQPLLEDQDENTDTELEAEQTNADKFIAVAVENNDFTINGNEVTVQDLEQILHKLDELDLFADIQFQGDFSLEYIKVINNKIISCAYLGREYKSLQFIFESRFNIPFEMSFDFLVNFEPYNVELNGYNLSQVLDPEDQMALLDFKNNLESVFYKALRESNFIEFMQVFYAGLDPNGLYGSRTPLDYVCEIGTIEMLQFLISEFDADVNKLTPDFGAPILRATLSGRFDLLKILYKCNHVVMHSMFDVSESEGQHTNSDNGEENYSYDSCYDPLFHILSTDNNTLLREYLDVHKRDKLHPPMKLLLEISKYSKECGCSKCFEEIKRIIRVRKEDIASFITAAAQGNVAIVKNYCVLNIDMNVAFDGNTALGVACENGQSLVIRELMQYKPFNPNVSSNSRMPIAIAAERNHAECVRILFEQKYIAVRSLISPVSFGQAHMPCIVMIALENDFVESFEVGINYESSGNVTYISETSFKLLEKMAQDLNALKILNKIRDLRKQCELQLEELFSAIESSNLVKIMEYVQNDVNLYAAFNGRYVLEYAVEKSSLEVLNYLVRQPNIDSAAVAQDGVSCLERAVKINDIEKIKILLEAGRVYTSRFMDCTSERYNRGSDLWRLIIEDDNEQLLYSALRYESVSDDYIDPEIDLIQKMTAHADNVGSQMCQAYLRNVLYLLKMGRQVFSAADHASEWEIFNGSQSISQLDRSVLDSLDRLFQRYNICFIDGCISGIDTDANFIKISAMIDRYDDSEIKINARIMYEIITSSETDRYGNGYADWVLEWKGHGNLRVQEVASVVVLAITDEYAISDIVGLTNPEILERERILVETLHSCFTAYTVKNQPDAMNPIQSCRYPTISCPHGTFNRLVACLGGGLHKDVEIVANPEYWAKDIASETLISLFVNNPNRERLSSLLLKNPFELTYEEELEIDSFYLHSQDKISDAIKDKVPLISNGGYLEPSHLRRILLSLRSITLPLRVESVDVSRYKPGQIIPLKDSIRIEDVEYEYLVYKLEDSVDSFYAAIILGAAAVNITIAGKKIVEINKLRQMVAEIILSGKFPEDTGILLNPAIIAAQLRGLDRESYVRNVVNHGPAEHLEKWIISALFNAKIHVLNSSGNLKYQITAHQLFIAADYQNSLVVMIPDNCNDNQHYNLAIPKGTWEEIDDMYRCMKLKSRKDTLRYEHFEFEAFSVLPGVCHGMDQIKIPGDGDCCFRAVYEGIKVEACELLEGIYDYQHLREMVANVMQQKLEAAERALANNLGFEEQILAKDLLERIFPEAIREYNEMYNSNIANASEYIAEMRQSGKWGGAFELAVMADLLKVNIIVYKYEYSSPLQIGTENYPHTIYLFHNCSHYNLLVNKGTWSHDKSHEEPQVAKKPKASYPRL